MNRKEALAKLNRIEMYTMRLRVALELDSPEDFSISQAMADIIDREAMLQDEIDAGLD